MKKFIRFLFNRITVTLFLLLIQIIWLAQLILHFKEQAVWLGALTGILSLIVMLLIVLSKRNPVYKIGWLFLVGIVPVVGIFLYILFSNKLPGKKLREKIEDNEKELKRQIEESMRRADRRIPDERLDATSRYIAAQGPFPLQTDTSVKYYPLGELMFEDMLRDMRTAEKFIFFEYFIVDEGKMWRQMKEIMKEKARQGVDVRVIYDDFGCLLVLPENFREELRQAGIKVVAFNPLVPLLALGMNNRDHRKILVVDGNIGYNGGINIADEYINEIVRHGHWKDTGVRLEGEATVNLTAMFLSVWNAYEETQLDLGNYLPTVKVEGEGFVQPFSDSPLDDELLSETVYMDILWQAKDYVYIFTPYLIIDHEMTVALISAAKRGVDVRLLLPKIPDKKIVFDLAQSYFDQLLEGGVRIYLYTPGFVHAKSYVSDDRIAVVGTINMDYRSLYLHFECGTFMVDTKAVMELKKDCLETFALSEEVKREELRFGLVKRLYQAVLRIISPLA